MGARLSVPREELHKLAGENGWASFVNLCYSRVINIKGQIGTPMIAIHDKCLLLIDRIEPVRRAIRSLLVDARRGKRLPEA